MFMYKLAKEKGVTEDIRNTLEVDNSWKTKLTLVKKYFTIIVPVLLQVVDSLLDALYFIKLKTGYRIINVPPFVHALQAVLLFTCKSLTQPYSGYELIE